MRKCKKEWNNCYRFLFHFFFLLLYSTTTSCSLQFFLSSSSVFPWCFCVHVGWCKYCTAAHMCGKRNSDMSAHIRRLTNCFSTSVLLLPSPLLVLFFGYTRAKFIAMKNGFTRINSIYCKWQFNERPRELIGTYKNTNKILTHVRIMTKVSPGTRQSFFFPFFLHFVCFLISGTVDWMEANLWVFVHFSLSKMLCEINTIDEMRIVSSLDIHFGHAAVAHHHRQIHSKSDSVAQSVHTIALTSSRLMKTKMKTQSERERRRGRKNEKERKKSSPVDRVSLEHVSYHYIKTIII